MTAAPSLASILVSSLAPLLLLWIWRRVPYALPLSIARITPWLSVWVAPVLIGMVAMGLVVVVWGSLHEPGVIHDERAIVLQARIFAGGHWRGPSPPEPSFFEQMHVFVEPGVASKYPPFHSAVLGPGVWLSQPGLVPVLLTGLATATFFVIVRRGLGGWVALVSTCLLMTAQPNLFWRASYFSETTTSALWLGVVWCFFRWHTGNHRIWLLLMTLGAALMGLTRPLSGVLLALPVSILVLLEIKRTWQWRQLVLPVALIVPTIGLVALWSQRTLDNWAVTPYAEYSRQNMPFDTFGFGLDTRPPLRRLPPDLDTAVDKARLLHSLHTWSRLPLNAAERIAALVQQLGAAWRAGLLVLFIAGIGAGTVIEALVLWTAASMFLGYLAFAHPSAWTVYYLEVLPVVPLLAVAQYWRLAMTGESDPQRKRVRADGLLAVTLVLLIPFMSHDVNAARALRQTVLEYHHTADARMRTVRQARAVVFVRMSSDHNADLSLIQSPVDGAADPLWVVRDQGEQNRRLCRAAPERVPYVYDEPSGSLQRGGCPQP